MIIHLGPMLPWGSSDLPALLYGNLPHGEEDESGTDHSGFSKRKKQGLFGLAPGGVCQASDVAIGTGELLPHLFTLTPTCGTRCTCITQSGAVYFLRHFPYSDFSEQSVLRTTLSCGARTFLPFGPDQDRTSDHLTCPGILIFVFMPMDAEYCPVIGWLPREYTKHQAPIGI